MIRVLQILPRVPPAVCGVAEYAWNLADALRREQQIETMFLAAGTGYVDPKPNTEHEVRRLDTLSTAALTGFVQEQADGLSGVILHLSPYGFASRGAPVWLARAVRQISQMDKRLSLVTMFHETYASGPWNSSAFWLQPVQKWVVRQIAKSSNVVRTHREGYAVSLQAAVADQGKRIVIMPVFSNFGEPTTPAPIASRSPQMIMFSTGIQAGTQANNMRDTGIQQCRKYGLTKLHLLGGHWPQSEICESVEIVRHSFLPRVEIEALLSDCRMGFMAYPPEYLGKSTFFAAMAAHGLAVVTQGSQSELPDGLREGREILHERSVRPSAERLQSVASGIHQWYSRHNLACNAGSYAEDIRRGMNECAF